MKLKQLLFAFAFVLCAYTTSAQTKVGTVNVNIIISKLPEIAQVQKGVEDYGKELEANLKTKLETYSKKVEETNKIFKDLSEEDKKKKQQEVLTLEQDIQKFRQNGAQLIQIKQDELMRPLYKKVADAVAVVAQENLYTQIFTLDGNELAYVDARFDITKLVAQKLGVKLEEPKKQ